MTLQIAVLFAQLVLPKQASAVPPLFVLPQQRKAV